MKIHYPKKYKAMTEQISSTLLEINIKFHQISWFVTRHNTNLCTFKNLRLKAVSLNGTPSERGQYVNKIAGFKIEKTKNSDTTFNYASS